MLNQEMLQTGQMEVQVVLEPMDLQGSMVGQVMLTVVAEGFQVVEVKEAVVLVITVVIVVALMELMELWKEV